MTTESPVYLFCWEDIPGNDESRLLEYLKDNSQVDGEKTTKLDDGNIIKVTADKNYVLLSLNKEKTEVHILINNGKIPEAKKWTAKTENGKLKIYPSIPSIYQSGIWSGAFMEGIWCGTGEWDPTGKWDGDGRWKSGTRLNGFWKGKGSWSNDKGNDQTGDWKGTGTLWENNDKKLGSSFKEVTIISLILSVVGGILNLTGLLGLKDIPIIFIVAAALYLGYVIYRQQLKGNWSATGRWSKNQRLCILTIKNGNWKIAGLTGDLKGTIEECKKDDFL